MSLKKWLVVCGDHVIYSVRSGKFEVIVESTSGIYSVSIPKLRAVCGGGDTAIAESALAKLASQRPKPNDYRVGPRIHVSWKSEIYLNEKPISKNELIEELLHPKWRGTMLYKYVEDAPKGLDRQGEFNEIASFSEFIYSLADLFVERGTTLKQQFCGIESTSSDEGLQEIRKTAELLLEPVPQEEFIKDLLNGKRRFRHRGCDYGYALESICECIGTSHGVLGNDRLRSLEIKTPLIKIRSPVRLPRIEDDPAICYLDETDLEREHDRLKKFKFSSDPNLIECQRKYQEIIESSIRHERGIVTFYY